ncbi:ABC transport system permease [Legionella lansingensis]|uniref:Putative ABC transport system permease n=1 Tax=Legionella lansingensis TaxID=45067 RepID=A0A0W0VKG4_9GAMM|nr:ABC transporter permease [Legionella lansingensis]KTD20581.1 putative ABC transport system permease [Legionella lansingensis]SNV48033.1 ABC transport system permease [Legionella lansingensis]
MYVFRRLGLHTIKFIYSLVLIFRFFGHLCHSLKDVLFGELSIAWGNMVEIIYYSGARLVIPLVFICALLGISVSQTVYILLSPFHLHHKVLPTAQNVLTHEVLPLLLGFILCIQAALHLINTRVRRYRQNPEEVILEHVWPIITGMNITSLLLYTYTVVTILISFYITFRYMLSYTTYDFMLHITSATTIYDLIYSAFKTLILCAVVSLAAGYYYYEAAVRHLSLRKAVSRIMTRSLFWLVVVSVYITFMI